MSSKASIDAAETVTPVVLPSCKGQDAETIYSDANDLLQLLLLLSTLLLGTSLDVLIGMEKVAGEGAGPNISSSSSRSFENAQRNHRKLTVAGSVAAGLLVTSINISVFLYLTMHCSKKRKGSEGEERAAQSWYRCARWCIFAGWVAFLGGMIAVMINVGQHVALSSGEKDSNLEVTTGQTATIVLLVSTEVGGGICGLVALVWYRLCRQSNPSVIANPQPTQNPVKTKLTAAQRVANYADMHQAGLLNDVEFVMLKESALH